MYTAFEGAVTKDAEMITRTGEKVYIVPSKWMANLMRFIQQADNDGLSRSPGKISNGALLQIDHAVVDPIAVAAAAAEAAVAMKAASLPLNGAQVDDRTARRERWTQIKQAKEGNVRKGLVLGQDYTLVGEGLWTLLSSKFGFDVSLKLDIEDEKKQVVKEGADCPMGAAKRLVNVGGDMLVLPSDGKFDYSSLVPDSDEGLVSEDDDGPADLQQEISSEEQQSELLLLPLSTTLPTAEISLDGMQVDQRGNDSPLLNSSDDEHDNDDDSAIVKTRKRKRYGSGLGNLGNTCFMNSTLQCLAHTGPLRSYFLSGEYTRDLNKDNPLGTGGELATEFARLLMEMWGTSSPKDGNESSSITNSKYSSYRKNSWASSSSSTSAVYPRNFKYTLGKHAERFVGYNQHDSQELAMYLLDALHEDTNRVSKKPYIEKPEQEENETDEQSAQKAWELHLQRDNSKVIENFIGQIKSKVVCPKETCGRVSTTFEPVMYLSVPLPGTLETTIEMTFVGMTPGDVMRKMNVTLPKTANMAEFAKKIALLVNESTSTPNAIVAKDIAIAETWNKEIYKFYDDTEEVAKISDSDEIFAYQVASVEAIREEQDEEESTDGVTEMQEEEIQSRKPRLKLDVTTLAKVNKGWEDVLRSFLSHNTPLPQLLNPTRKTHEERIAFHKKLVNFLNRCYSCQECKSALQSADDDENDGKMSPTSTVVSRLGATVVNSVQSLEELCHLSSMFRNITTAQDVAGLQFCSNKFLQTATNMVKKKKDEYRDGVDIQIDFRKPGVIGLSDKPCGLPLILRISPTLSVYGLRKILAERLKEVINCNEKKVSRTEDRKENDHDMDDHPTGNEGFLGKSTEELRFFCQIPLTYERKSYSYSYSTSKSGSYRKLGSVSDIDSSSLGGHTTFAIPEEENENERVLDIVGKHGRVHVHFPTKDSFDTEKWEKHECQKNDEALSKSNGISVLDCIEKYCEIEQLDETEMWYCDKCKEHVAAWKHIHLYRMPPILIVHFKRFHYNSISHRRDKIDLLVDFPLKGLDLRREVMHWDKDGKDEPIYDCYAVSNHFGGLGGGHYTAYALNDEGEWSNFDDSRVTKNIDESEVVSSAAYMLFYRRRDVKNDDEAWIHRIMPSTLNSLDSSITGRMDIEKVVDVTDEETGDNIESDTMLTSSPPTSTSPMIASMTDESDDMELQ